MKCFKGVLALLTAISLGCAVHVTGLMETFAALNGPLFSIRYPRLWEEPRPFVSDPSEGFVIITDTSRIGRRLGMPDLHITIDSGKTWPDMDTAIKKTSGEDARNLKVREVRMAGSGKALTFDKTFVILSDHMVGGQLIIGDKVPMRFYMFTASDGRIAQANYNIPRGILGKLRARVLFGRILNSLEFLPQQPRLGFQGTPELEALDGLASYAHRASGDSTNE